MENLSREQLIEQMVAKGLTVADIQEDLSAKLKDKTDKAKISELASVLSDKKASTENKIKAINEAYIYFNPEPEVSPSNNKNKGNPQFGKLTNKALIAIGKASTVAELLEHEIIVKAIASKSQSTITKASMTKYLDKRKGEDGKIPVPSE